VKAVVIDPDSIYLVQIADGASELELLRAYLLKSRRITPSLSGIKIEKGFLDSLCVYSDWISEWYKTGYSLKTTYTATEHARNLYSVEYYEQSLCSASGGGGAFIGGGLDYDFVMDIVTWWTNAWPIIEQIVTATGALTGIVSASYKFIKWVRKKANKKQGPQQKTELEWVEFLLAKDEWNVSQLADALAVTKETAKNALKGFGYKWDRQKMLYIASDNTVGLRNISHNCENKAKEAHERKAKSHRR